MQNKKKINRKRKEKREKSGATFCFFGFFELLLVMSLPLSDNGYQELKRSRGSRTAKKKEGK